MNNLYVFVEKEKCEDCIKYGMKLSEFTNKLLVTGNSEKKGILAYLSPKDSDLFFNDNYSCLRVNSDILNVYIYNKIFENTDMMEEYITKQSKYVLGTYEEPMALISSTILPENISLYNKTLDVPLIIENSKEFYYKKSILELMENEAFSNYEIYQVLLLIAEQKGFLKAEKCSENLKVYIDKKRDKKYTRKGNF